MNENKYHQADAISRIPAHGATEVAPDLETPVLTLESITDPDDELI